MARGNVRDKLIAKLVKLANVTHEAHTEDMSPEDGFQFDDDVGHAKELAQSSMWGWCCVKTTAEYAGFHGVTYLGACSYESADNFLECEGKSQAYEACAALLDNLMADVERGKVAVRVLHNLRGGK